MRRAAAVAAGEGGPEGDAERVLELLEGEHRLLQPQLLALVEADRAAQAAQQHRHQPAQALGRVVAAPAGDGAADVVVAERPAAPAVADGLLQPLDDAADALGRAGAAQQVEAVGDVEAAAVGVLGGAQERVVAADLAQDHLAVVALGQRVQGLEEQLDQLGPGLVPELLLHGEGRARGAAADRAHPARRVVAQLGVVDAEIDRVEPEAVDAALEPEAGLGQQRLDHLRVVEVEVGLLLEEVVQVVLAAARLPLPGAAAEHRQPVAGRRAVGLGVGPDVPVGLGVVAALPALLEPGVLVAGVAGDEVHHHLEAEPVGLGEQRVEVRQRAEQRVDGAVVGDVVAVVLLRALAEGRDPDRVDAQLLDIFEPPGDARQVADAVAVRVLEAARVDLVDDGTLPPQVAPVGGAWGQVNDGLTFPWRHVRISPSPRRR